MLSLLHVSHAAIAVALAGYVAASTDYLIVGGGTAGLVLAERLTEDPNVSVLVIEAGGDGLGNVNISDVNRVGAAWGTAVDWAFPLQPLYYANNRQLSPSPRGKVLGGSSAINGDVFMRGDAIDYNQWETLQNPGWNFDTLFPASIKSERFFAPNASQNIEYVLADHGTNGPVDTAYHGIAPEFHNTIIQGVVNAGGIKSLDLENGTVIGISHMTSALLPSNSTRSDSATAYYFPNSYRSNMQVLLNSTVTKIVWTSTPRSGNALAKGVEYVSANGTIQTATATTVILCGGTWGTPPILERSGIGNATLLSSLGIESVVDLPGVGENLVEQTLVAMQWQLNGSLPTPGAPFLVNVETMNTTLGANVSTFESLLNTPPVGLNDAQWNMYKRLYAEDAPWIEHFLRLVTPANSSSVLNWDVVNLHPLSRGSAHIVSANGTEYPSIQLNFFQNPIDLYITAAAAQRAQQIVSTHPIADFVVGPNSPAAGVTSIDDLSEYSKATVVQTNHVMGTALLAPREDGGVVDPNLKVYGTANVYVVDACVIPLEPSAHSQATVYAVAERAAELFKNST
ncbi:hypothetical protein H0H92_004274 [Tricholoma furcatifolium]|nr:hypothetical protein H0H92_004274 [Tricholoma furcatifolium]